MYASLKKSPLYKYRIKNNYLPVIGEGSSKASIVFVGEAPGKKEAETGKPFCGRSGKMLDELLASIGMDRQKVYVTNLVKDRPQDNRDPSAKEIALYGPFLDRQLEILKPKVVVTLGRLSMAYLFNKYGLILELQVISKIHSKAFIAKSSWGEFVIIALYHPAVALYNGGMKKTLLHDFKILKNYI
jgi:DNA polymerase